MKFTVIVAVLVVGLISHTTFSLPTGNTDSDSLEQDLVPSSTTISNILKQTKPLTSENHCGDGEKLNSNGICEAIVPKTRSSSTGDVASIETGPCPENYAETKFGCLVLRSKTATTAKKPSTSTDVITDSDTSEHELSCEKGMIKNADGECEKPKKIQRSTKLCKFGFIRTQEGKCIKNMKHSELPETPKSEESSSTTPQTKVPEWDLTTPSVSGETTNHSESFEMTTPSGFVKLDATTIPARFEPLSHSTPLVERAEPLEFTTISALAAANERSEPIELTTTSGSTRFGERSELFDFTTVDGPVKVAEREELLESSSEHAPINMNKRSEPLELTTVSGSVKVGERSEPLEFTTVSGSVKVGERSEPLELTTVSGSVKVGERSESLDSKVESTTSGKSQ